MGSRPVEVHTSFPDATGKYQIGRMPPGDYIGSAVGGIGVGDEWDPELRKRVESIAQLFSSEKGNAAAGSSIRPAVMKVQGRDTVY
jgi:hypothetical protein